MGWTAAQRKQNRDEFERFTHKYEPAMVEVARPLIEAGATMAKVGGVLGVTARTMQRWMNPMGAEYQPEFAKMVPEARQIAEGRFDEIAMEQLENPNRSFNPVLYQMVGRRRYQWSEHRQIDLRGIEKCKTYQDKIDFMFAKFADNPVSAQELQMLTNSIGAMAKAAEIDDIKLQLEQLKDEVKHG